MRRLSLNHSVYQHEYHIVWGTRYRRKFLKEYVKPEFEKALQEIEEKYPTIHIVVMNINNDHVHLQMEIPPNLSVAVVVKKIKWYTSKVFKKRFKFIREMYLDGNIWSVGYFVSSLGLNETQIRRYIEWQDKREVPQTIRTIQTSKQKRFGFE